MYIICHEHKMYKEDACDLYNKYLDGLIDSQGFICNPMAFSDFCEAEEIEVIKEEIVKNKVVKRPQLVVCDEKGSITRE